MVGSTATVPAVAEPVLRIVDDELNEVAFDATEATALLRGTGDLEAATVSACPDCRSRVVATVALIDLIDAGPALVRAREIVELADDAPTLHLYVIDECTECRHRSWLDPGYGEWLEVVEGVAGPPVH